jgi:hypothetical protein
MQRTCGPNVAMKLMTPTGTTGETSQISVARPFARYVTTAPGSITEKKWITPTKYISGLNFMFRSDLQYDFTTVSSYATPRTKRTISETIVKEIAQFTASNLFFKLPARIWFSAVMVASICSPAKL